MLKIELGQSYGLLEKLAALLGTTVKQGYLKIPKNKGQGYLRGFRFGEGMGMMIKNCVLHDDLLTRRHAPAQTEKIMVSFNNVFPAKDTPAVQTKVQELPSVQIGKGSLHFEMFYPSFTTFRSILIAIDATRLKELLGDSIQHALLTKITESDQPLLFEAFLSPEIQQTAIDMTENEVPEALHQLYFRVKAEELICLLFAGLLKRDNMPVQALNETDAEKIFQIRDKMLVRLDVPPVLNTLAREAGMSVSKLKRLFTQIFGDSVFNYYQGIRMKEAARLLKEKKYRVSEVGYQMGFSNLSHFSRTFEAHIGMKPKKYAGQIS
jgi:AraC-like DNA-binding protein